MPSAGQIAAFALAATIWSVCSACSTERSRNNGTISEPPYAARRMLDGRQWMTGNLNVATTGSHCYENNPSSCDRYGRLYTWVSAQPACASLGNGWRLPTDGEWRQLAKGQGGISEDSTDGGKGAYAALMATGSSGFDALLSGGRQVDGGYARIEAHGLYWTASESGSMNAVFYNFGKGSLALYRQPQGDKRMALAVRCVRD